MSIIVSSTVSPKPQAVPDEPMLTPEQLIEQIHALRRQIPEWVSDPNNRDMQRLRNQSRLDILLTHDALSVVGKAEVVQSVVGNSSAELHDAENQYSRWLSAESELRALLRGVTAANVVRRFRLARAVREVYKISRSLAEKDLFAQIAPHVESMYRVKNRKKGKTPDTEAKQ